MKRFFCIIIIYILLIPIATFAKDIDNTITLTYEDMYNANDAGSFDLYYRIQDGEYEYFNTFYFDKNISTKKFNIAQNINGIKIVKKSGYELNLDEVTLNGYADKEYEKKLSATDNDIIEIEDYMEFNINGKGQLIISGRAPINLRGNEYAFKFPEQNFRKEIGNYSEFLNYEINSNFYRSR